MRAIRNLVLVCGVTIVARAMGQDTARPPIEDNPLLTDLSADQILRERLARPVAGVGITPTRGPSVDQVEPGQQAQTTRLDLADGSSAWIEGGTLRPEGTYLVGWTGEVARLRTGGLAFLPVRAQGAAPEPAMALLPCDIYGRIEGVLGEDQRGLWLSLTGEVLVYHGRNYLLPTAFAGTESPESAPTVEPEPPAEEARGEEQPAGDRIDELVRQLEAERAERRGIDTAFGRPGAELAGTAPGPRLDGRMLLSRRARMVRSTDGGWVIAIDNDHAGGEMELPHRLRLLPCRVVAQMETQAESLGEGWDFEVSGHLYRSGQAVYLLPRMFVTMTAEDVEPLQ